MRPAVRGGNFLRWAKVEVATASVAESVFRGTLAHPDRICHDGFLLNSGVSDT